MTVGPLGVPYGANPSFRRGPAQAPSAIRAALACGSAKRCNESGIDLDRQPATSRPTSTTSSYPTSGRRGRVESDEVLARR